MGRVPVARCVLRQLLLDEIRRQNDQITERAGPEQARVRLADAHCTTLKDTINLGELLERRLAMRPHERVG